MGRGPGAGAGWEAIYKFVTERAGSLNIKDYYEVKKKKQKSGIKLLQRQDLPEPKHHTQRAGELGFITLECPEELTLSALSPEQRGYQVFIGSA